MIGRVIVLLLFVTYVVEASPHLVHHLFEHDEVQADCTFAIAADRHHAAPAAAVTLVSALGRVATITPAADTDVAVVPTRPADARAPPHPA